MNPSPYGPSPRHDSRRIGRIVVGVLGLACVFLAHPLGAKEASWEAPIGIPNPEFGIHETYRMYDDASHRNPDLPYRKNAEGGYVTHVVDARHAKATDSENPFGSLGKPRKTVPASLPVGSVVEVHNGPYELSLTNLKGTREKPIFIRGPSKDKRFKVTKLVGGRRGYNVVGSHYFILENAEFFGTFIRIGQVSSYLSFRHCEINGNMKEVSGFYIWTHKGSYKKGDLKEHLVFYDNHIHHCIHYGFMIDNATQNVWIVDNHIHDIHTEDGVQIIDRNWVKNIKDEEADRIFIGRNRIYNDSDKKAENAIDAKGCTNLIISQNLMYGYKSSDSSDGEAVRINDEGHQDNIWILFNHIHSSKHGISPMQSLFRPYIFGNYIHDCQYGISRDAGWVINNTICNTETAILDGEKEVANNIIVNATKASVGSGKKIHHNIVWKSPGLPGKGVGNLTADPLLAAGSGQGLGVGSDSPAKDAADPAAIDRLCETFFKLYKIDLKKQLQEKPHGKAWDIGAHEFVAP